MAEADRTIVIGAGAAGIAAARTLYDAGRNVLMIEARDRLGGRADTLELGAGIQLDRGCGWLHSAPRNPWTAIARAQDMTIAQKAAKWSEQWCGLGYSAAEQAAFGEAWEAFDARAHGALDGPDRPLSNFVDEGDRWRSRLDTISGFTNGAPLADVSLHDWANYEDYTTDDNWAVREGYGTLITGHARDVPIRLNTIVSRIDHRERSIRVETNAGTIVAGQVIVTVSTDVLAREAIAFDPPLPDKIAAADALPLGLADKVFLQVDQPDWPGDSYLIGDPYSARTASYRLSPFGWPVIEAFFGGSLAEELEDGAAEAFAVDELVKLLGSDWRQRLTPLAATCWRHEAHIHGSYSHARVGHVGARLMLAAPVNDRLFFAGEACSPHDFSTAHGAYETGVAAAEAILALHRARTIA